MSFPRIRTQEERTLIPVCDGGIDPLECNCEFDPFDDGDPEESVHYKRSCVYCKAVFWSTHCIHEGGARNCGSLECRKRADEDYERWKRCHFDA